MVKQSINPKLVSSDEAAKLLGISPRKLWTLRNKGQIPYLKLGGCVRYSVAAIDRWIKAQTLSA